MRYFSDHPIEVFDPADSRRALELSILRATADGNIKRGGGKPTRSAREAMAELAHAAGRDLGPHRTEDLLSATRAPRSWSIWLRLK